MKTSLYELAYHYLRKFIEDPSKAEKKEVMEGFKHLLDSGWTTEEIGKHIKGNLDKADDNPNVKALFSKARTKKENLLNTDTFYWHPQLRITPGAPKRTVDYNTGVITRVEEEDHYLEMKASYTLEDLYFYYVKQHDEPETLGEVRKFKGGLKYLLGQYSLDTILFMIDASANHIHAEDYRPLNSPLDVVDYIRDAQAALGQKITEERTAGDDKIVPRKRVSLHRGRSEVTERDVQAESYA